MTLQALANPVPIAFTHRASYSFDPIIQVEIAVTTPLGVLTGRSIRTEMLVDSGADITALDGSLAAPLGLDLRRCPVGQAQGIGGVVPTRLATLQMYLCGRWLDVPVAFHPNLPMQLLGRRVVFDNLFLAFAQRRNAFYAARA